MTTYVYDEDAKMVDFRGTEEKMADFFRRGSNNLLAYREFLTRVTESDQILEYLFELACVDYTSSSATRTADTLKIASAIQNILLDIVEEMIEEGEL